MKTIFLTPLVLFLSCMISYAQDSTAVAADGQTAAATEKAYAGETSAAAVEVAATVKYIVVEVTDCIAMGKKDRARYGKKVYTGMLDAKYYDTDGNEIYNKQLRLTNKALYGTPAEQLEFADFAIARPETMEYGTMNRFIIYSRLSEPANNERITSLWQLWRNRRRK